MDNRPSWDEYFIQMADAVSKRATCDRGRSGCVIVRDNRLLVTGYVGSPKNLPHCDDVGHQMKTVVHGDGHETQHCVRTVHAEQNAICQAARFGIPIDGATLYCRMTPCRVCAMMIINCGIRRVYCEKKYHDSTEPEEMLREAGISIDYVNEYDVEMYPNQKPTTIMDPVEVIKLWAKEGKIKYEVFNDANHFFVYTIDKKHLFDFWPTHGKWREREKGGLGGLVHKSGFIQGLLNVLNDTVIEESKSNIVGLAPWEE